MPDSSRWTNGGDPSLNEINRADRFFESLAAKQPAYPTDHAEAELAFLFAGLRDDVRDAPITAQVSLGDAVDALNAGTARGKASRRSLAVVGSVAAAMLCIGGFGTAVYGASPGDSLYGMRTALFGQHEQTRDDQVSLASAQLQQVQQLIDDGQWEEAQTKLAAVSTTVQDVGPVEQKQQLVQQWNALTYKVVEQDPAATLAPGEPLPALPSSPLTWLPVPVVEATPSSDTTTSGSPSTSAATSDTTATSPSDSTVPSGSTTPPSDGSSATPSSVTTSGAPSSGASSGASSSQPSSSVPVSSASPTSVTPTPTSSPAAQPAPSSSPSAVPSSVASSTPSSVPSSSTTTTVSRQPAASQPSPPPVSAPPAERSAPAEPAPVQPSPAATSPAPAPPVATTTVVPPG